MENFDADPTVFASDSRILAAVSSGADSMALLWWLHSLKANFIVGHVNHALHELRPGECARDENFVRQKCAELGVPFHSKTVDLPRRSGHVNELVAREARYVALAQMARENNCNSVATAHTATDGLETAILNLMRGAAPGGWLGIAPRRVLEGEIWLVRPLWRVPRAQTRQILLENGWNWREDASNEDALFRRNRVRHEVLPLLAEISGREADSLALSHARHARIGRDEANLVEKLAGEALESMVLKREEGLLTLDGLRFRALDVALQRRVLRMGARDILPELRDLEGTKVEATREWIMGGKKRVVWMWRSALRVEWTGAGAGNRIRFWRV